MMDPIQTGTMAVPHSDTLDLHEYSADGTVKITQGWQIDEQREAAREAHARKVRRLQDAVIGLLTREDFWWSCERAGVALPGEVDDLRDAVYWPAGWERLK